MNLKIIVQFALLLTLSSLVRVHVHHSQILWSYSLREKEQHISRLQEEADFLQAADVSLQTPRRLSAMLKSVAPDLVPRDPEPAMPAVAFSANSSSRIRAVGENNLPTFVSGLPLLSEATVNQ